MIRTPGYVYFATTPCQRLVKIGYSCNPETRIASIRSMKGEKLRFLACTQGTFQDEKQFHVRFAHLSIGKEWFFLTDEIRELLKGRGFSAFCPSSSFVIYEQFSMSADPAIAKRGREELAAIWSWAT